MQAGWLNTVQPAFCLLLDQPNHLLDDFEQKGKLLPKNPQNEAANGTDGHNALGLRGAGTRRVTNQRLDNKVLFCAGQVPAVHNPLDPFRQSHNSRTTGVLGMEHGTEAM